MIAFLDFETTGLDPRQHEPIELAVVVTDDTFQELACAEWLIRPRNWRVEWDPFALEMHNRSGLARLAEDTGRGFAAVAVDLEQFLDRHQLPSGPLHLGGNSVNFDRSFLREYMPKAERLFHHRHLDVSSIRMLAERVTNAPQLPGDKPHRAMADVRRSIAELHHWTAALRGTL